MIAVFLQLFEGVSYANRNTFILRIPMVQKLLLACKNYRGSFQLNIKHKRVFKSLRLSPKE